MPRVKATSLSSTNQTADQSTYTSTGSIVLAASRLHLWVVLSSRAGADPSIPALSGRAVTWELVGSVLVTPAGATRRRLSVFRGVTAANHDASTDGMVTTFDFGGETQATLMGALIPLEHAAISRNGADAIVALTSGASAADADGYLSVALPAQKHTQNAVIACWGSSSAVASWAQPGADYIETAESAQTTEGLGYHVGWSAYNTPVADLHATAGLDLAVLALEIRPALYESLAAVPPRTFVETEWDLDPGATGTEKWRRNTHLVKGFRIRRGRRTSLDRIEAATMSCVMDGSDRRFESGYAGVLWNYAKNPTGGASVTTHWSAVAGATLGTAGIDDNPSGATRVFSVNSAGGTAGQGIQYDEGAGRVPVDANALYSFSHHFRSVNQQNNSGFKLQVEEYNAAGASIRLTETSWTLLSADSQTWRRPSITLTTLATTATVIVRVLATTTHSWFYVANLQIEKSALTEYIDGDMDNGRWEGAAGLSRSFRGGPYHPNVRPMRRIRVLAAYENAVEDSSLETVPLAQADDPGPSGPDGSPWWHDTDSGGVVSRVTAPTPVAGTYVYKAEKTVASNSATVRASQRWAIPVEPGEFVRATAYFQRDAASPAGTYSSGIGLAFFDRSWTPVGSTSIPTLEPPVGRWVRARSGVQVVPPAAAWVVVQLNFFSSGAPVGTIIYADAVQVDFLSSSVANANPIVPYRQGYGTFRLFTGYITRLPQETLSHRRGQVTLECVDGFAVLAKDEFVGSPPSEGSTARVTRMLDSAGWPATLRKLDAGTQTLAALSNVTFSHLQHLLDVTYSELGAFFIDGTGRAVLHDKNHRTTDPRSTTSRFTFGDAAGELPYLPSILPEQDVARVRNEIKATRPGGIEQVATDATSIGRYFTRTLSAATLHSTDAATLTWAQAVLAKLKEPPLELERLDLDPSRDPLLWAATLALEIGDRITVNRRPQGLTLRQFVSFIEAIEIAAELTERSRWRVSLSLSPAA